MFILRAIKRLFFFGLFAVLVYLAAHYPVQGKPLYSMAKGFFSSDGFQQGFKDLKMFLGGFLKSIGEEIQETVTEEDKKQLESIIKEQVQKESGEMQKAEEVIHEMIREGEKKND